MAEVDTLEDDDFALLAAAAAVEVEAMAALQQNKRQKLTATQSPSQTIEIQEGSYMAALRGSRSSLWQQQQQESNLQQQNRSRVDSSSQSMAAGGGACFKCGMEGHWARDCGGSGSGLPGQNVGATQEGVAEKPCPCGAGMCLVRISNTAKNPGRRFYKCPVREENGGCNFFEWCDNPSTVLSASKNVTNSQSSAPVPDLPCLCGAGSCLVLLTKTGKNAGQKYYCCPADEENSCGFFKWCNEWIQAVSPTSFSSRLQAIQNNHLTNQLNNERRGSSCFKCGKEGHWARDCPIQSTNLNAEGRTSLPSTGSNTCFKCGKDGHWARDCPSQVHDPAGSSRRVENSYAYNRS